jgi:RNA-binding protein YlmH
MRCPAQDILIQGEGGAQILVEPELAEHFEASLTQVRSVPVETRVISLSELRVAPPKKMAINSIEASLRLDAVASAGGATSWSSYCQGM